MKNIFVGNLDFGATEDSVRTLFEPYGAIERVNLVTDRDTGRPRGFAFVEMTNAAEADRAIDALNGVDVERPVAQRERGSAEDLQWRRSTRAPHFPLLVPALQPDYRSRPRRLPLDLLLADMKMPGMSGFDPADLALRLHPPMKIVFLSGDVESGTLRMKDLHGVPILLVKPIGEAVLMRNVELALGC